MPLHFGYLEHPQNFVPGCFPFFATRKTILDPHLGHVFDSSILLMWYLSFGFCRFVFSWSSAVDSSSGSSRSSGSVWLECFVSSFAFVLLFVNLVSEYHTSHAMRIASGNCIPEDLETPPWCEHAPRFPIE